MDKLKLQIMDVTSLKAVLTDLRKEIIPSRFEKAQQLKVNTIQLGLRTLEKLIWLEISWDASSARLVEINTPPKSCGESTLAKQINHALRGMALIELKQEGFERIVELGFALRPNQPLQKFIVLELMGRHSNLFLLNKERQAITLGRQIRAYQSRLRPVSTGDKYTSPPVLTGAKPDKSESFECWKERLSLIPISLEKALLENYQGISPALILQLASDNRKEALKVVSLLINQLSEEDWKRIYQRWLIWLTQFEKEEFGLCFTGSTPYQVWGLNNSTSKPLEKISITLGKYYQKSIISKQIEDLYNELNKKLLKLEATEQKNLHKQNILLNNIPNAQLMKKTADQILSLKSLTKKQVKEAQNLYQKVKKMRRSESILEERIDYHSKRIELISESQLFLDDIFENNMENKDDSLDILIELKEELETHLFFSNPKTSKRNTPSNISSILELPSPSGLSIQIGRNHRQNEIISLKKARRGDLWFHSQECPGSHVVLKASNGIFEDDDLQICADLAAFFSKARLNKKVPVIMVKTNQLQKLKGSIPGTVTYRGGKIIWGDPLKGKGHLEKTNLGTAEAHNALSSAPS